LLDQTFALCEHKSVNVISSTAIKRYAALQADASEELIRWYKAASCSVWRDLNEVRQFFPDADQYRSLLIFNIRHNRYRLIVKVDYRAKLLMVKEFLSHDEYMRGGWKRWAH
jgi:mRNA interferase HigB